MSRTKKPILAVIFFLAVFIVGFLSSDSEGVLAADDEFLLLKGYAWSSNIGWISLSCEDDNCDVSDYQVRVNSLTGVASGYAWSSNIGWIKFDPAGPYPESPNNSVMLRSITTPSGQRKQFQGWARACTVLDNQSTCSGVLNGNNGGWDGWIKMSGNTTNCPDPSLSEPYEVCLTPDGQNITGYAWGGDVIGWIQFAPSYDSGIIVPTSPTDIKEIPGRR